MITLELPSKTIRPAEKRYTLQLNVPTLPKQTHLALILKTAGCDTNADAAVFYRLDSETDELHAAAFHAWTAPRVPDVRVALSSVTCEWLHTLDEPAQGRTTSGESAAGESRYDKRVERFPEVLQFGINRLLVLPLRIGKDLLGVLTLGRVTDEPFTEQAVATAADAARILTGLLERDVLKRQLEERRLVERAKGILQRLHRMDEESAYLMLRTNSRKSRRSMAEIARQIIDTHVASRATVPARKIA